MRSINIKEVDKKYTNVLKDTRYIEAVSQWSINICDLDELRTTDTIVEVVPLEDGSAQIIVSYKAFQPTWLQKIYYKYWVGIPVENFAKIIRES